MNDSTASDASRRRSELSVAEGDTTSGRRPMSSEHAHRIHHAAIVVADVDASLRFWRDGLGFELLMDETFEGDWKTLFGIDATKVRSVMVGDPSRPGSGIVEFVQFLGADVPPGFELLSLFVGDVDEALAKLGGAARELRRIEVDSPDGPVPMVTVRDPDGVLVEIIGPPNSRK